MINQCSIFFHRLVEPVDDFRPLTEEDGFATTRSDFFHISFKPLKLCTLARQRVEIRNLFQSQNKLKNVLD